MCLYIYRYVTENTPEDAWESGNAWYDIYLYTFHLYLSISLPHVSLSIFSYMLYIYV